MGIECSWWEFHKAKPQWGPWGHGQIQVFVRGCPISNLMGKYKQAAQYDQANLLTEMNNCRDEMQFQNLKCEKTVENISKVPSQNVVIDKRECFKIKLVNLSFFCGFFTLL